MAHFVLTGGTNSGTVNFPKVDAHTIPPGIDPAKIISGSEWNSLCQAATDLRQWTLSGSVFGFGNRYANPGSVPTIPGHDKFTSDYFYIDNNAEMTFHKRENTEYKLITTNFLNRTGINQVFVPSGTLHVYSDGSDPRMLILQMANTAARKNSVEFMREVTNQKVFVGQYQNASDGWVPANAFFVEVFDGGTTRNVMHVPVDGDRITFGHSSNSPFFRVGVNTTTPQKRVDINGDLRVAQSASLESDLYLTGSLFSRDIRSIGRSEITGSIAVSGSATVDKLTVGGILQQQQNYVTNGNFDIWQRGSTDLVKDTSVLTREFFPDRWNAYLFKFNTADTQFTFSRVNANLPLSSGTLSGSDYAMRIKCDTASGATTDNWGFLVQEIDRDFVKEIRGKNVTITSKIRVGNEFTESTGSVVMYVRENTGPASENLSTYSAGVDKVSTFIGTAGGLTGSWRQFSNSTTIPVSSASNGLSIWIGYVIQSLTHTGGPGDYIEFGETMLTPGLSLPVSYALASADSTAEFDLCKKYYEKSYPKDVKFGTVTEEGIHQTTNVDWVGLADTFTWPIGSHPRFTVEKRVTPTVKVWDGAGNLGAWSLNGLSQATAVADISSKSFKVINFTGGAVTLVQDYSSGHWDADAEI